MGEKYFHSLISVKSKPFFPRLMPKPRLYGSKTSKSTDKVLTMLSDAKIEYQWFEVKGQSSQESEMLLALTGSMELPQLFVGGQSFVGVEQIHRHIG
tara:strand:- start:1283 stop:1573 length:291 start_codon:yes stop_codon:yes gene_type:complete